jgi:hypothetical protein
VTTDRPRGILVAVFGLVLMIGWTVAVKYVAPWCWAIAERTAGHSAAVAPVMWDFWPLAHALLAWALWTRPRWAFPFALAVAFWEIAVVTVKFASFLRAPEWTFWRLLWFTNKIYVLAFFLALAFWLVRRGRQALVLQREI